MAKSMWQKMKELKNPGKNWDKRKTGRDEFINRKVKENLNGKTISKKKSRV